MKEKTRARILANGVCLLSKAGLAGTTLGNLAHATGISKSGLFAHFTSKEDVEISLLRESARLSEQNVIRPSMAAPEGLPRLQTLIRNWLGWAPRAGLPGGCPVAAALFELDDVESPVRDEVQRLEKHWRDFLESHVRKAMEMGHLSPALNPSQFVWEVCGIYLNHHVSLRFIRDDHADSRAATALTALLQRSMPDQENTYA